MSRNPLKWSLETCRPVAVCLAFASCVVIYTAQQIRLTEASYCLRQLEKTRVTLLSEQADLSAWAERLRAPDRVDGMAGGLRPASHWQLVSLTVPSSREEISIHPLEREAGAERLIGMLVASPAVAQESH